ncbi:MAG: hypothetical protein LBQ88_17300 [Treponema sp.]|nr:hypothetical protein [Treponema sp.]
MEGEIEEMLKKDAVLGGKIPTFFTDTWDGFGKDDPDRDFTNTELEYVNNNNSINTAVNDAMADKTGQRLVELLTELRDNTKELHLEER